MTLFKHKNYTKMPLKHYLNVKTTLKDTRRQTDGYTTLNQVPMIIKRWKN